MTKKSLALITLFSLSLLIACGKQNGNSKASKVETNQLPKPNPQQLNKIKYVWGNYLNHSNPWKGTIGAMGTYVYRMDPPQHGADPNIYSMNVRGTQSTVDFYWKWTGKEWVPESLKVTDNRRLSQKPEQVKKRLGFVLNFLVRGCYLNQFPVAFVDLSNLSSESKAEIKDRVEKKRKAWEKRSKMNYKRIQLNSFFEVSPKKNQAVFFEHYGPLPDKWWENEGPYEELFHQYYDIEPVYKEDLGPDVLRKQKNWRG